MTVIWSQRDIEMTYTMFHLMENGFSRVALAFLLLLEGHFMEIISPVSPLMPDNKLVQWSQWYSEIALVLVYGRDNVPRWRAL